MLPVFDRDRDVNDLMKSSYFVALLSNSKLLC